ncbi:MAG: methyltransferase family protein, partial [Terriglobales bacterium]
VWARRSLGGNWSSSPTLKQGHELVQRGPYGYVRNPIYTALLLMLLGTCIFVGRARAALAIVLAVAGLWVKLKQEEALMERQFPDTYPPYRKRVKALIPYLL